MIEISKKKIKIKKRGGEGKLNDLNSNNNR